MFTHIKKWFSHRAQNKAYKKIKADLLSDPKLLVSAKDKFEKAFGVNSIVRTKEQWIRLVNVYGIETVAKTEGLSVDQIKNRCNESFTHKVNRILR